jgi:hypothetical protein
MYLIQKEKNMFHPEGEGYISSRRRRIYFIQSHKKQEDRSLDPFL